mmetsp:Transcript_37558/g.63219  ORF Transcript_37558/g.63219 Transcript_37558/m.63219 type:complete len:448 (-) Transcript_37558:782-2125(-)
MDGWMELEWMIHVNSSKAMVNGHEWSMVNGLLFCGQLSGGVLGGQALVVRRELVAGAGVDDPRELLQVDGPVIGSAVLHQRALHLLHAHTAPRPVRFAHLLGEVLDLDPILLHHGPPLGLPLEGLEGNGRPAAPLLVALQRMPVLKRRRKLIERDRPRPVDVHRRVQLHGLCGAHVVAKVLGEARHEIIGGEAAAAAVVQLIEQLVQRDGVLVILAPPFVHVGLDGGIHRSAQGARCCKLLQARNHRASQRGCLQRGLVLTRDLHDPVVTQSDSSRRTRARIFVEQCSDELHGPGRDGIPRLPREVGVFNEDGGEHLLRVLRQPLLVGEGILSAQELVDEHAGAKEIRFLVITAVQHLGGHVRDGAASLVERRLAVLVEDSEPEVGQLEARVGPRAGVEVVLGLDVAVHDFARVALRQRLENGAGHPGHLRLAVQVVLGCPVQHGPA